MFTDPETRPWALGDEFCPPGVGGERAWEEEEVGLTLLRALNAKPGSRLFVGQQGALLKAKHESLGARLDERHPLALWCLSSDPGS